MPRKKKKQKGGGELRGGTYQNTRKERDAAGNNPKILNAMNQKEIADNEAHPSGPRPRCRGEKATSDCWIFKDKEGCTSEPRLNCKWQTESEAYEEQEKANAEKKAVADEDAVFNNAENFCKNIKTKEQWKKLPSGSKIEFPNKGHDCVMTKNDDGFITKLEWKPFETERYFHEPVSNNNESGVKSSDVSESDSEHCKYMGVDKNFKDSKDGAQARIGSDEICGNQKTHNNCKSYDYCGWGDGNVKSYIPINSETNEPIATSDLLNYGYKPVNAIPAETASREKYKNKPPLGGGTKKRRKRKGTKHRKTKRSKQTKRNHNKTKRRKQTKRHKKH